MRINRLPNSVGLGVWEAALGCCVVAFIAWLDLSLWHTTVQEADRRLQQMSAALSASMDATLRLARAPIAAVVAELSDEEGSPHLKEKLVASMKALLGSTDEIHSLSVIDAEGRLIASSLGGETAAIDISDRDYFRNHAERTESGAFIGRPVVSRLTGELVIPVSERFTDSNGRFRGVVVAAISLTYLTDYFEHYDTGRSGSVLVTRADGTVLATLPLRQETLGANYSKDPLFSNLLLNGPAGKYQFVSDLDGVERNAAYVQSQWSGVVTVVAMSRSDLLGAWFERAGWRWACLAALLIAAALFYAQRSIHQAGREIDLAEIAAREAEFRLIAEGSADLIVRMDANFVRRYASPAAATILGRTPASLIGRPIFDQAPPSDAAMLEEALKPLLRGERPVSVRSRFIMPSGETRWLETHVQRIGQKTAADASYVATTRDITLQVGREQELQTLALTDPLTHLANRRLFDERLTEVAEEARRRDQSFALLLIDADKFKLMNDLYGHMAGDKCLKAIADVCKEKVHRLRGTVARIGGEELAIILPRINLPLALEVAEHIRSAIESLNIEHSGNAPWSRLTASIGVAISRGTDTALLFQMADKSLYQAKAEGRNRVCAGQYAAA